MLGAVFAAASPVTAGAFGGRPSAGCSWWNLVCQGGHSLFGSGLSAVTRALASGIAQLLSQITKVLDSSTRVPLADPTYRHIYFGFAALAVPLVAVVLLGALIVAAVRRDGTVLRRAVGGVGVAAFGGALFIVFAQLLVAVDNWLSHAIVGVTGHGIAEGLNTLAAEFSAMDPNDQTSANMLMILLMLVILVAGLALWFVFVLRQIAILVVVAFAPLLIAGWLWAPTRSWVRRATETVVALIFTKAAIFALFGIGLALLFRDSGQTMSDFVGEVILLCGACFAPLGMLKLVHFAADSHIAAGAMGSLRGGVDPVLRRGRQAMAAATPMGRTQIARQYAGTATGVLAASGVAGGVASTTWGRVPVAGGPSQHSSGPSSAAGPPSPAVATTIRPSAPAEPHREPRWAESPTDPGWLREPSSEHDTHPPEGGTS